MYCSFFLFLCCCGYCIISRVSPIEWAFIQVAPSVVLSQSVRPLEWQDITHYFAFNWYIMKHKGLFSSSLIHLILITSSLQGHFSVLQIEQTRGLSPGSSVQLEKEFRDTRLQRRAREDCVKTMKDHHLRVIKIGKYCDSWMPDAGRNLFLYPTDDDTFPFCSACL